MMNDATDLVASLVAAYPPYVEERISALGLTRPESLGSALEEGAAWLEETLGRLLTLPFDEQRRGPLEVFQEAMRYPTEALAAAGVEPVARDPGAMAALPGDTYNLAPASSRLLGDEVWMGHLSWGAAKARALDGVGRVGLLSANLMDRARIEPLVERAGSRLEVWDGRLVTTMSADGRRPDLLLADLEVPNALAVINAMAATGVRVIAFGPHVDRAAFREARIAGAEEVLARSAFFAKLGDLLG